MKSVFMVSESAQHTAIYCLKKHEWAKHENIFTTLTTLNVVKVKQRQIKIHSQQFDKT